MKCLTPFPKTEEFTRLIRLSGHSRKLLVGVDEAGYGPNLGPLVVAAVWLEVPAETLSTDLWQRLAPEVSRFPASGPEAIVFDDSKRVYTAGDGLLQLERSALTWIGLSGECPATLRDLWSAHCLTSASDLDECPWYAEQNVGLPRLTNTDQLVGDRAKLSAAFARADFGQPGMACQIIMPGRFNELVGRTDSKAAALFEVAARLLRHLWESSHTRHVEVVLDKHGGRNFYGPLLQQVFQETLVLARCEGPEASQYTVATGGRRLEASFLPRADAQHLLVAAASMIAKYIRELWMELFNSFWTSRIPGLQPTAGYPTDAKRFWNAIRPVVRQLGLPKELLWRQR